MALAELAAESQDQAAAEEAQSLLAEAKQALANLEAASLLGGEYDRNDAILSINAGAGGTEACDWVDMLARMYLRWAERHGFTTEVVDQTPGEQAGSKSVTMVVRGPFAYGQLQAERGVHRLVRLSPFDAAHRRHTTFASVDAVPEIEESDFELTPDDLKVETYRSTGAGGQHVNKTESAVRLTHLPTGLVAQSQNERSQHQNRATALGVLRARVAEHHRRQQEEKLAALRGEQTAIAWGNQIRSYVLHPYNMVKDHRTGRETGNTAAVLDGELDGFIQCYLEFAAAKG